MVKRILSQNTFGVVGTRRANPSSKLVLNGGNGKMQAIQYDRATTSNNIYLSEIGYDGTVTVLSSVAAPFVFTDVVAAAFQTAGDIALVAVGPADSSTRGNIRYIKYTRSTNSWGAWENVPGSDGSTYALAVDVCVGEIGDVLVTWNDAKRAFFSILFNRVMLAVKKASDGTWFNSVISDDNSTSGSGGSSGTIGGARANAISIASLGTNRPSFRDYVIYYGCGFLQDGDYGVTGYKVRLAYDYSTIQKGAIESQLMRGEANSGGDTGSNAIAQQLGERVIRIYRIGNGSKFAVAIMHGSVNYKVGILVNQITGSGTEFNVTSIMPLKTSTLPQGGGNFNAISAFFDSFFTDRHRASPGAVAFTGFKNPGNSNLVIKNVTFRFTDDNYTNGEFSSPHEYGIPSGLSSLYGIHSLGDRNVDASKVPILVESYSAFNTTAVNAWEIMWADLGVPQAVGGTVAQPIKSTNPADGSVVPTAHPTVTSQVDLDTNSGQSKYKVHVQFAKNTGFTTSLIDWYPGNSDWGYVAGTLSGPSVPLSATLPNAYTLTNGTWYMRARLVDEYSSFGPWTGTRELTVGHPPQAGPPFSPINAVEWIPSGSNSLLNFDWEFTDTSPTDSQTAFQVRVYDAATNSLIHESGKVLSTASQYQITITSAQKDVQLYWQVKLWDTDDVAGTFSAPTYFLVSTPPVVTVDSPTSGSVLPTGVPTISGNIDVSGGRDVKEYTVSITQGGVPIWSVRRVGPFPDGYVFAEKVPQGYLQDEQSYTLQVSAIEAGGLQSTSGMIPFSVDWIPPAGPDDITADLSHYNTDGEGYVLVEWGDESREAPNFVGWNVYRKSDLLNTDSGVVIEEGQLVLIHQERAVGNSYQHQDYFAPSGYKTTYYVTQVVNRDGQDIESDKLFWVMTVPQSDGYWLLAPSDFEGEDEAFKLSNVTGDNFTHEREESEIVVIGVGRTFQKGQDLGVKGTLDAQLRHTNGTTARQKKLKIEQLTDSGARLWLRNPFGDIYPVNVSALAITRIAGVGTSEFCDIQIPYAEVGR